MDRSERQHQFCSAFVPSTGQICSFGPVRPIFDDAGKHILNIGVERDISIAKKTEIDLTEAKQTAEQALLVKTEFLATMSHEIRTPMNGIVGMSDLLGRTALSDEQSLYVQTIADSGAALLSIIDDILYFSKLEASKLELSIAPFAPTELLNSIQNLLEPTASKKGLKLNLKLDPENLPFLRGDKGRIRQIIVNLVGNAIKFTNEGQVTLMARCMPKGGGSLLSIKVKDSGIGIPADKLSLIFDAFTQVDSKTTRRADGTGLGLSISKQLARQMDGDIVVESSEGDGTCFTFSATFPHAKASDATPLAARNSPIQLPQSLNILIAEDNLTNQLIIRKILEAYDTTLRFAKNGAEVVEMYTEKTPDIVLMDISMPILDGLEATRRIREFEKHNGLTPTPIIALTANAFESDRKNCFEAGMNGFVTKPILVNTLIAEIGSAMAVNRGG